PTIAVAKARRTECRRAWAAGRSECIDRSIDVRANLVDASSPHVELHFNLIYRLLSCNFHKHSFAVRRKDDVFQRQRIVPDAIGIGDREVIRPVVGAPAIVPLLDANASLAAQRRRIQRLVESYHQAVAVRCEATRQMDRSTSVADAMQTAV